MKKQKKSLTRNAIFYIIYNIMNIVFPLLTGIYSAQILTPDSIGMVESAKNLVQYFVILSFLGIPTYGLREISKFKEDKEELNKIYSELMVINFISTCVFFLIYLLLIIMIPRYNQNILLYFIVGILILLNFFNNSWLYEGLEEFKYISIRNIVFKILSFLCLIIFVRNPNDYLWYASITVIGTAGNYVLNIINSKKIVKFSTKKICLKRHLKSIFYLVFVNLAIEIYSLVDITMLDILCQNRNVAFYSYGMKIYKILIQVLNSFTIVVVPKLAQYYKEKNIKMYNVLLSKTLKILILLSIPLIAGIYVESDIFVTFLYGEEYITSSCVLKILSIALLISPIGYLLGSRVMLVTNNENKMIIPVMVGAIINAILNYNLIPCYKEMGAAFASVLSELSVMSVYLILSKRYFHLEEIWNTLEKVIISCIIMLLYLTIINNFLNVNVFNSTIIIIGAIIIYFGVLCLFKEETTVEYAQKLKKKFVKKEKII